MKKFVLGMFISIIMSAFFVSNFTLADEDKKAGGVGINLSSECTMGMGKNCFDYEQIIGIDKVQNPNMTAKSIAQDTILAATYMVGTVLTIVIIYCGLMYIFASRDGKDVSKYKNGLIYAAIGALLVWGAYAIVRLIQYIAKG